MTDLIFSQVETSLASTKDYSSMAKRIKDSMPEINKTSQNFYKSASQYKNVTLDITDLTTISSIKHILAVIEQTKVALEETYFKNARKQIDIKEKEELLSKAKGYEKQRLEIDILELQTELSNSENYIKGAVRKLNFLVTQYHQMMDKLGKKHLTEEDYERNEARHHIMTAMKQALCAARARGGLIDEGNQIYLFEMGINGAVAQAQLSNYLAAEQDMINNGLAPNHEMTIQWLSDFADKYLEEGVKFAESRGFKVLDETSLVKEIANVK